MNSSDKLLKCIVCLNFLDASVKNECAKGHIHCQNCANSLDETCGLCELPLEPIDTKEQDQYTEEESQEISQTSVKSEPSQTEEPSKGAELTQKLSLLNITHVETVILENVTCSKDPTPIALPKSLNITNVEINPNIYDTLRTLHTLMCKKKCKTFDHCINNLLLRVINESSAAVGASMNSSIKGTESITDLLETLHVRLCEQNCDNIEICLDKQLKKIVQHQKVRNELLHTLDYKQTLAGEPKKQTIRIAEPKKQTKKSATPASNVTRCLFDTNLEANKPVAQFEFITKLPKNFEHQVKPLDEILPESNKLPTFAKLEQSQCPMPNCNARFDVVKTVMHLKEQHKSLSVEVILAGDCKTFFVDPSILEQHVTDCLFCYFVPSLVETNNQQAGLPIFLLACRTSLSKLYGAPDGYASTQSSDFYEQQEILTLDAEIDEAIYGSNSKLKSKPVLWSHEDVLIVWPIALIPQNMQVKTVLSAFVHNKPTCHRALSFNMRSMQHSREPFDVFGAPDALTLTNVEIEALTNGGQHAIQCQIMCNL